MADISVDEWDKQKNALIRKLTQHANAQLPDNVAVAVILTHALEDGSTDTSVGRFASDHVIAAQAAAFVRMARGVWEEHPKSCPQRAKTLAALRMAEACFDDSDGALISDKDYPH